LKRLDFDHVEGLEVRIPDRHQTESQQRASSLRPRIKVWLQCDNGLGFGSRFVAILEAVDRTGSLKHAAADQGWSYRYVWSRVKRVEAALGYSLVNSKVGGQGKDRSELTPAGRDVVSRFHRLRTRLLDVASREAEFGNP
jgi:molybdate transport system regulatory protein